MYHVCAIFLLSTQYATYCAICSQYDIIPQKKTAGMVESYENSLHSIELRCHLTYVLLFHLFVTIQYAEFCKSLITYYAALHVYTRSVHFNVFKRMLGHKEIGIYKAVVLLVIVVG